MKRIIYILLILSAALNAYHAKSQNCPASPTYLNQSGTFELTSGRSIVLNNGGSFQITVQNTFYSNASICVTNGSTLTLQFQNVNTILKGGSIYVDATSKLIISGNVINSFPLTLTNAGTVTQSTTIGLTDGGTIINSGTYNMNLSSMLNGGAIDITNSGTFNANSFFTFNSGGAYTITNSGTFTFGTAIIIGYTTFTNSGTTNFRGDVTLQGSSVVRNTGYLYLQNGFALINLLLSGATVSNGGVLYVTGSITINSGSILSNSCTVRCFVSFYNNGTVTNNSLLLQTITSPACTFTNQGTFTNGSSALVQGYNFNNNGTINGGGNFYFTGTTTNQGPFGGTNGNTIDFYDITNLTTKIFDIQNTNPTNTIKLPVTPNTVLSLLSCSDVTIPAITKQPSTQYLCSVATTSATFSVTASSSNTPTYQWYKNSAAISGATASSYTAAGLTMADTANAYSVAVTNTAGTSTSSNVYVKYIILSQPSPVSQYLATGNSASFSGIKISNAVSMQWQKNGNAISGATSSSYSISTVNYADSGKYTVLVSYNGGTCTSDVAALKTSVILYSKASGKLNVPGSWGVNTDGSGSSPVDFTRSEHTFIVSNRAEAETGASLTIAGTLDIANANTILTAGTTLQANRITRSLTTGSIVANPTASLVVGNANTAADPSDLYFNATSNTLRNLTINANTVALRTALNLASGTNYGVLQVNSGTFNTSDLLTVKSDSLGTAGIAKSAGTITGKVTIEKWMHARRAYRLIGAPITSVNAPTINAAWQEGATNSSANPAPGFGTHITGGTEANGFDLSPTNSPSLRLVNIDGTWTGLANTNKTAITQYASYMLFVRGNRSYNISSTTNTTAPTTTILRVKGNVNQGTLAATAIPAKGYITVTNPYAAPINFARVINTSTNIKKRIRVWDPTLAGTKGTGAWVIIDGTTGTYRATPPSTYVTSVLQAGQGFIVESADGVNAGSLTMNEDDKDFTSATISGDRVVGSATDTSLEVNLKLFNDDSTISLTDGVLYNFGSGNNDSADVNDAAKLYNTGVSLTIQDGSQSLAIDSRTSPKEGDSLKLNLSNNKAAGYQFEIVPSLLENKTFALYDKYLDTLFPISSVDTTRITFSVGSADASKAADRFLIVVQKPKAISSPLPVALSVTFVKVKAEAKDKAISVKWNVEDETDVLYYTVEKSADGSHFAVAGNVTASAKGSYSYTDGAPVAGINYYRITAVTRGGSRYSVVTSASFSATASGSMGIYPNPITGTTFMAALTNIAAGTYTLSVMSSNGTTVAVKTLAHSGGTASQKVTLSNPLPAGIYYIRLSSAGAIISTTTVTAQ